MSEIFLDLAGIAFGVNSSYARLILPRLEQLHEDETNREHEGATTVTVGVDTFARLCCSACVIQER